MSAGPPLDVVLPLFLGAGVSILASLSLLSRLVRIERERHPDAWETDGRPVAPREVPWKLPPAGSPSRPRTPSDPLATNRILLTWLFRTPTWMFDDGEARRLLWALRAVQAVALACVVGWIVLLAPFV